MKNFTLLSLFAVLFLAGCTTDSPGPSTDVSELKGEYGTNGLLDPSCVAISDESQLPSLTASKESGGTYRLVRTDFIPNKRTTELRGVTVVARPDTLLLFMNNQKIGHLAKGKVREFKGNKVREKDGALIQVMFNEAGTQTFFSYFGYKK